VIENKILQTNQPTASEEQLNEFGLEGWKLVTIIEWDNTWYYYFIRFVKN